MKELERFVSKQTDVLETKQNEIIQLQNEREDVNKKVESLKQKQKQMKKLMKKNGVQREAVRSTLVQLNEAIMKTIALLEPNT